MIWWVLCAIVICLVSSYVYKCARHSARVQRHFPPGPSGYPLIGCLLTLMKRDCIPIVTLAKWSYEYGPVYSVQLGRRRVVIVGDAETAQQICIQQADKFSSRPQGLLLARILGGKGIVFNDGIGLKQHRQFALHEFRKFGLSRQSVDERIQQETDELLVRIAQLKGEPCNPHWHIATATYNIIWNVVSGERFSWENDFLQDLIRSLEDNLQAVELVGPHNYATILTLWHLLKHNPARLLRIVTKRFSYFWQLIKSQKEGDPEEGESLIKDYLRLYNSKSKDYDKFSDFQLLFLVSDLFVAGGETTITTMRWALLLLAYFPEFQEDIRTQISETIGMERVPMYVDRVSVPKMEAFIHEVLRFAGVVPVMWRATSDDAYIKDYRIPKGTWVLLHFLAMHHQPKVWQNPEKFQPERFLDQAGNFVKNDNFLAFSAGKRQCIGEFLARSELFIILTSLLQKYTLAFPGSDSKPDLKGNFGVTVSPPEYRLVFRPLV